jgi:superfamily II DNA or RNA helicase
MRLEPSKLSANGFVGLPIVSFYSTTGDVIASQFIEPVLRESVAFDRLTGYFSVHSMVSAARGLQGLYANKGKMRLVLGIHDVPAELISAMSLGQLLPADLVATYKERLLSEIDLLSDEAKKSAISGIAWMMRLGILEIKVAAPRSSRGIFHQKRMIFRDGFGNVIAGTGSLNETMGSRENVEEMQFNLSWQTGFAGVDLLVHSFEEIWSNSAPEVSVFDLDEDFATQLLLRTSYQQNPFDTLDSTNLADAREVLELARSGIAFTPFNLSSAVLYPHQERVFAEALSRWPVRVLMADEVGLGKTLEAGTAISYLYKFHNVRDITVLAPAGLVRQWQEELWKHFELDFWRWDSGNSSYVSSSGEVRYSTFDGDAQDGQPKLRIVSAHWARMKPHEFKKITPQLMVIDEAHAARVTETRYGSNSTLLWKLVNEMCEQVPHVILLTATPMQVHPSEYHGLLALLGLPDEWRDYSNYEESLQIIAGFKERPTLQQAKQLANLLLSSFISNEWMPSHLTNEEMLLIMDLRSKNESGVLEGSKFVLNEFQKFRTILIKIHPGHFYTCRNTKSGLKQFGYVFPERRFIAPEIVMPPKLDRFENGIENYLTTSYGKTEEALVPKSRFPISFAKTSYYQRLVSSLYAAKESLYRRKSKISAISRTLNLESFDFGLAQLSDVVQDEDSIIESSFYDDLESKLSVLNDLEKGRVQVAARQELLLIDELIEILDDLGEDISKNDPKFHAVMKVLAELLLQGPVLVFSRYTDTLKGFLGLFEKSVLSTQINGYSFYTGGEVWIKTSAGMSEATKTDVTNALDDNRISIVFCSDAASEGLNLQSAQSIINIDVPWNPARLEQRIGRIARLGQKANVVNIVNVWYPNSIESKMYSKLLERKDDYELAVGEFPDIFSDSIRQEVADLLNPGTPLVSNLAADLVGLRQNFQTVALKEIWKSERIDFPASREMREDLIVYVSKVLANSDSGVKLSELSSIPGNRFSVGINHEILDLAAGSPLVGMSDSNLHLYSCYLGEVFISFAIGESNEKMKLMNPLSIGKLLRTIAGDWCLSADDLGNEFHTSGGEQYLRRFIDELPNIPHHGLAKTISENHDYVPRLSGSARFVDLGKIGGLR